MTRTEEYVLHDGTRTQDRIKGAKLVSARAVAGYALVYSDLPPHAFVGFAAHESRFAINEVDTEPDGFVSKGIFQISDEEAAHAGFPGIDLLVLENSVKVFARMLEGFYQSIVNAVLPKAAKHPDIFGYLAIAHNEGMGAMHPIDGKFKGALGTIALHGLDWFGPNGYAIRNASRPIVAYGGDVITGGAYWRAIKDSL